MIMLWLSFCTVYEDELVCMGWGGGGGESFERERRWGGVGAGGLGGRPRLCLCALQKSCVHFRSLSRVFSVYFTVHIILNF